MIVKKYNVKEIVPLYMGYCYYIYSEDKILCAVVPLNIVIGIVRNTWKILRLRHSLLRFYDNQIKLREKNE